MDDYLQILSVFFAALAVYVSIYLFRVSKTLEYMTRLQDPNFVTARVRILKLTEDFQARGLTDEEKFRLIEESPEHLQQVVWILNFLQELAVGYRYGLLQHRVAFDTFDYVVMHYWESLRFMVDGWRRQNENSRSLYRRLEWLYERYRREADRQRRRNGPAVPTPAPAAVAAPEAPAPQVPPKAS